MSNAYTAFVPTFHFRVEGEDVDAVGGFFWDGRADTAQTQAVLPFLNPLELNNKDAASVLQKIASAPYAKQFKDEFGQQIFNNPYKDFPTLSNAEFHRIGSRKRSNAES